jgi:hypothetical protein
MVLPDGQNAAARKIQFEIGVPAFRWSLDPARRGAALNEPDGPVRALAENHDTS